MRIKKSQNQESKKSSVFARISGLFDFVTTAIVAISVIVLLSASITSVVSADSVGAEHEITSIVFKDDFLTDSRSNYTLYDIEPNWGTPSVGWSPGVLKLMDNQDIHDTSGWADWGKNVLMHSTSRLGIGYVWEFNMSSQNTANSWDGPNGNSWNMHGFAIQMQNPSETISGNRTEYWLCFCRRDPDYDGIGYDLLTLNEIISGTSKVIGNYTFSETVNWTQWHKVKIERTSDRIRVWFDSIDPVIDAQSTEITLDGYWGMKTHGHYWREMWLSNLTVYSIATPTPTTISIDNATTYINSTIQLPIQITNATDLAGGSVKLTYNSSIATIQSITSGDFGTPYYNIGSGYVNIAVSSANAIGKENATLAKITFKAIADGTTALEFSSASLNDESGNLITPNIINGSLTVTSCMLRDLNGNNILDTGDATLALQMVVGLRTPDLCGDMNGNGRIDTGDATLILRKVVGLD